MSTTTCRLVSSHPAAVLAELRHPVRLAFVPTMTIALLLVATAGLEVVPRLAAVLWWVAMPLQLVVTLFVLTAWIGRQTFGQEHVTPAWFIPVVGVVVVPLVGVSVGPPEISWFFFSVGVVSWMALLPVVLGRLLLHGQELPAKLVPTLAVLVAPPAVAFLALLRLLPAQSPAPIARVLYYAALFFALLVLAQIGALRRAPFALSWWAYSFPAAALTVATLVMAREPGGMFLHVLAWMLLVGTSLLVAVLTVRTVVAMLRGRICVPE